MYTTTVDSMLLAINELRETVPDARISEVAPCANGNILFYTDSDIYYRWDILSGCISQCRKGEWRKAGA